jgi:hypothetical protein
MRMLSVYGALGSTTSKGSRPHEGSHPESSPKPKAVTAQSHCHTLSARGGDNLSETPALSF